MITDRGIELPNGVVIPLGEIRFRTSRSGGPGGQHVNKVETRIELIWDLASSAALGDDEREALRAGLGRRARSDGTVHVTASRYRSQAANRRDALERFDELLTAALAPRKRRKKTRRSAASEEKRLDEKRRRSEIKRQRRPPQA